MRILLTAYGPFREVRENITERVAYEIQKSWHVDDKLSVLKLPVEWRRAEAALTRALEESIIDVVVSMGHAERSSAIGIETRYFNIAEGEDNRGERQEGGVIDPDGDDFCDTNIDTAGLASHLAQNDVPAVLHSGKGGMTYLCNFAGYIVMRHIRNHHAQKPLFIFLHLPPAIPLAVLVKGVNEIINFLIPKARPEHWTF